MKSFVSTADGRLYIGVLKHDTIVCLHAKMYRKPGGTQVIENVLRNPSVELFKTAKHKPVRRL
ncbi:MAG: hypothetical protein HPY57_14870 [Ignavibacteria bacterium]|nr:hypothetical protein [Ignavibacteria bacterium]